MVKDKLITLLIEQEKRDRLKQHCADLGLNVSQVLSKCIDDILSGSINPAVNSQAARLQLDIDIAIEKAMGSLIEDINTKFKDQANRLDRLETDLVNSLKLDP